ncbi:EutN/CcmL family microcompartment protein [Pelagicoccus sp. SDUM812002]|uniref:EutN/CcmL family microcompartment protein n=1 Tax=Pelagicoccus sp. SDUM812002 TaxID=3041266 RepID=UPI00280E6A66|nr:EutN/CcmL family microcompartment protein [Pelagicoccus sp. SDUM812002]MDQ8188239.1 EutN/CcmL family microcompartment protein [Pelagicoccus sp. SDUM812002]
MRFGKVIGRVVLGQTLESLTGARWLMVKPLSRAQFKDTGSNESSTDPALVVYDKLGAGLGDVVGFTEGGEAMLPLPRGTPVDAYCAMIVDRINLFGTKS